MTNKIDAFAIYKHAVGFLTADSHLRSFKDVSTQFLCGPAAVVLSAFASELFIKCLLTLDSKSWGNDHNLHRLYKRLNEHVRRKIEQKWLAYSQNKKYFVIIENGVAKAPKSDLEGALKDCGDAFVAMRYVYEDPKKSNYYISELPIILREVILEEQPNWKTASLGEYRELIPQIPENKPVG